MIPPAIDAPAEVREQIEAMAAASRRSLLAHIRFVHRYNPPAHQREWIEALEDDSIRDLLIIAPPKYGKTPIVTVDYIGWKLGRFPGHHFLEVSNTATQANKNSVALRSVIESNWRYKITYGLKANYLKGWGEGEWFVQRLNEADKDPSVQAFGIDGPMLGATVDEIICDDICDEENMATPYQREKLMDKLRLTVFTRRVPGGRRIWICTRWHEDDPAGHFMDEGWTVLHTKATDSGGNSTYPHYWPKVELDKLKVEMGTRRYALVYDGEVIPEEGSIIKRGWWRYWGKEHPLPETREMTVQIWDTAFKTGTGMGKSQPAFSVCLTWAVCADGYYLLDMYRERVEFPQLKRAAVAMYERYDPEFVLIEDAASGMSLVQELRQGTRLPIVTVKPDRDKIARLNAATPTLEAGRVFLPKPTVFRWVEVFQKECETFPNSEFADIVDCLAYFLNWVRERPGLGIWG